MLTFYSFDSCILYLKVKGKLAHSQVINGFDRTPAAGAKYAGDVSSFVRCKLSTPATLVCCNGCYTDVNKALSHAT